MKNYEFNKSGIDEMYDNVCTECINVASNEKLNDMQKQVKFEGLNIKISIGNHEINIPNNADYIDIIFDAITKCNNI